MPSPNRLATCSSAFKRQSQIFFSTVITLLLGLESFAEHQGSKFNILYITIDDLNDWVGCLQSHPQVKTPNIDRLAERGLLFTNAHCQAPVCNPSRTSVMLGLRPSTTGIYSLQPSFKKVPKYANHVTIPKAFKLNGYATSTLGKIYHGALPKGEFDKAGTRAKLPNRFPPKKLVNTPQNHKLVDWGIWPPEDSDQLDYKTADWAVNELSQKQKDPFFMAVGFSLPHVPLLATQKWFDLYPEDTLQFPRMLLDDRNDTPRFSWYLHWKLPEPRQRFLFQAGEQLKIVQAYLASISFMDSQVGRILEALDRNGYADNTIVVLWSDHGYHLGEKEITGKNTLWDRSARVPLIFAGPGIKESSESARPVELLDVYPTLSELCGLPSQDHLEGLSLVPLLKNPNAPRYRPAITTDNHDNHGVRTEEYRYIQYADGSEEFYDMIADPNEFTNLADNPKYARAKRSLKKHLPKVNRRPVKGSAKRILIYENGVANWEGEDIGPNDPIPD